MQLGVTHSYPLRSSETLSFVVDPTGSETLEPLNFSFDIGDHDVEVHAVLSCLGFGHLLKEKRRRDSFFRDQYGQIRV